MSRYTLQPHVKYWVCETASWFSTLNPVLRENEIGLEKDTTPFNFKIGDGVTRWNDLSYVSLGGSGLTMQNTYDNSSNPEITTDSTRGAVSLKRGSGADTDDVFEVMNGAGTQKMAVTGNGKIFTASETASRIASINAGQELESLDTATYPSLTELAYLKGCPNAIAYGTIVGTFAQGNDSRFTNSRYKAMIDYDNTTTAHTGNTTNTIVRSGLLIPANTLGANSILEIISQWNALGTAGTKTMRIYLNTTDDLAGTPQLIGTNQMTATQLYGSLRRRIVNKNSVSANAILTSTTVQPTDDIVSTSSFVNINWDFSVNTYVICAMQLGNAGDTGRIQNIQLEMTTP